MPLSESILILMVLLCIAVVAENLCRRIAIPYTVFLVIIGVALAQLAPWIPQIEPVLNFTLTPEMVFFLFLPALVFESALNLDPRQMLKELAPILSLAVPALLLATAVIGLGLHWSIDLPLVIALLFGSLIAATDPVAVVSLFKELGVPNRLMTLVEGESLLNDATAIVIFNIILGIALMGEFSAYEIPMALLTFLKVFLGGALIGLITGFACAELMYRLSSSAHSALIMTLVAAYLSFVIAEHGFHLSGVMAVLLAAITMGLHSITRLNDSATHLIHESWEVIATIANALLFLMIGLSVDLQLLADNFGIILLSAGLVLLARGLCIYSMVPLTTRLFKLPAITLQERTIMWWGGLKGGLAIAIVLSIPDDLAAKPVLVALTLGVVLFTLLVNASTIRPLLAYLKLDQMNNREKMALKHGLEKLDQDYSSLLQRMVDSGLLKPELASSISVELKDALQHKIVGEKAFAEGDWIYAEALRTEFEALEQLYRLKLMDESVYIGLRLELRDKGERLTSGDLSDFLSQENPPGLMARIDHKLLKHLREFDAAAPLLAQIQRNRMAKSVQRDLVSILAATQVQERLQQHQESDSRELILSCYRDQAGQAYSRLQIMARDFPQFYGSLEQRLFQGAALLHAKEKNDQLHKSHEIGGKVHMEISAMLEQLIAELPETVPETDQLATATLVEQVPIFNQLQPTQIERLSAITQLVDFIPGDTVIEEGQHGNALYIIAQGEVTVTRLNQETEEHLATLKQGDFFGEGALLGDSIRSATVRATTPLRLIRMSQEQVMELADVQPEIAEALEAAQQTRQNPAITEA